MKTQLFKAVLGLAAIFMMTSQADAQAYTQGGSQLNAGIGIGSTFLGAGFKSTLPPIGISYEYGLKEKISVGGYVGYAGASHELAGFGGTWKWNYSYIIIGARGSYHFATSDKLDPYAGLMLGYNMASVTTEKPAGYTGPEVEAAAAGGFGFSAHLGARYFFTEKFGAFGELGYGISFLQLGLTAKF